MQLLVKDTQPYALVRDDYMPATGELVIPALPRLQLADYTPSIIANQLSAKDAAHYRIKTQAQEMIDNLAWRIERAKEREDIGADGESIADVLREREAVRRASNRAEQYVDTLEDEKELRGYTLHVLSSDYPENPVVTRLTFMRRFTDAERASIRAARDSGQSQDLLDFWELLQLATSVNLNDVDIQAGVAMLETNGLIGAGRAGDILTI